MSRQKSIYLTNEQLAEALLESQKTGHPTEKVCEYFRMIAGHMLGITRYRNYPQHIKEDMCSAALLKCIKNIKNFRSDRAATCFNYFTRTTECAFWEVLGKHYKQQNIQRELTRRYADQLERISTTEAKRVRDQLLKKDTTNTIHKEK